MVSRFLLLEASHLETAVYIYLQGREDSPLCRWCDQKLVVDVDGRLNASRLLPS